MGYRSFYDGLIVVVPPIDKDEAEAIMAFIYTDYEAEGPMALALPTMPLDSGGFGLHTGYWVAREGDLVLPEGGNGYKYDQTQGLSHICEWLASRGHVCSGEMFVNGDEDQDYWMIEVKDSIVYVRPGKVVYGPPERV